MIFCVIFFEIFNKIMLFMFLFLCYIKKWHNVLISSIVIFFVMCVYSVNENIFLFFDTKFSF